MMEDPARELAKIAEFLGIQADAARVSQAVERSSADQMRKMEKADSAKWVLTKNTRTDISFVRRAGSGGWKDGLPASAVAEIESAWGPLLARLGYSLTKTDPKGAGPAGEMIGVKSGAGE